MENSAGPGPDCEAILHGNRLSLLIQSSAPGPHPGFQREIMPHRRTTFSKFIIEQQKSADPSIRS